MPSCSGLAAGDAWGTPIRAFAYPSGAPKGKDRAEQVTGGITQEQGGGGGFACVEFAVFNSRNFHKMGGKTQCESG